MAEPGPQDFRIVILCALDVEVNAMVALFDERYPMVQQHVADSNVYAFGRLGKHKVVLAFMHRMGGTNASNVGAMVRSSFPRVELCLVVGVCGSVPSYSEKDTIREIKLGDVIVSTGIVVYQSGRQFEDHFERRKRDSHAFDGRPAAEVLGFLKKLREVNLDQIMKERTVSHLLTYEDAQYADQYRRPDAESADEHREIRQVPPPFEVHFGPYASGEAVYRSATHRDALAKSDGVLGFEMEGFGVWPNFPTMIVKAVCDFADDSKDKVWQSYSASIAAAYTKAMLREWKHTASDDLNELFLEKQRKVQHALNRHRTLERSPTLNSGIIDLALPLDDMADTFSSYNHYGSHQRFNRLRTTATCQWIFEVPTFEEWFQGSEKRILWLHGNVGAGKTMIMSVVVDFLLKQRELDDRCIVYFYVDRSQPKHLTVVAVLKSFVKQLLQDYRAKDKEIPAALFKEIQRVYIDQNNDNYDRDVEDLTEIFYGLFNLASDAVYLIDGLDELAEDDINALVILLQRLDFTTGGQKLFLTSRTVVHKDVALSTALNHPLEILVRSNNTEADIAEYIESKFIGNTRLRGILTEDQTLIENLKSRLSAKAKGSFLWVALQIEVLWTTCQSDSDLASAVQSLPDSLDETYNRCWDRIAEADRIHAVSVLHWIASAKRPLRLAEIREAISVESMPKRTMDFDCIVHQNSILRRCSNLVVLDEYDSTVRFAHSSVGDWANLYPGIQIMVRNSLSFEPGTICLKYLSFREFQEYIVHVELRQPRQRTHSVEFVLNFIKSRGFGLFDLDPSQRRSEGFVYSTEMQLSSPGFESFAGTLETKFPKHHFARYVRTFWIDHTVNVSNKSWFWPVFRNLVLGPPSMLCQHPWLNTQSLKDRVYVLLNWAVRNAHWGVLCLLVTDLTLSRFRDRVFPKRWLEDGLPALHAATIAGRIDLVDWLLQRYFCGPTLNFTDDEGRTAYFLAASNGYIEIAKLLARHGAKAEFVHEGISTLALATKSGNLSAVQYLLANGAKVVRQFPRSVAVYHDAKAAFVESSSTARVANRKGVFVDLPPDHLLSLAFTAAHYGHKHVLDAFKASDLFFKRRFGRAAPMFTPQTDFVVDNQWWLVALGILGPSTSAPALPVILQDRFWYDFD